MPVDFINNTDNSNPLDLNSLLESYKRLQQLNSGANAKPVTQTIKTDPKTGEETVTITGNARDLSAANPNTPTVTPAYNQYIGQQESGNNPNIGFHDLSKSTAYGQFGITQPAWQDIQRAAPQFAGRDITTLSPQEQAEANNILRSQYSQQLQNLGVQPTEASIRLAHLLGPTGAHQYLTTGQVSPQAAAANGGETKLRQIADQRLASAGQQPMNPLASAANRVLSAVIPSAQAAEPPQGYNVPQDYSVTSPGAVQNRDAYRSMPAVPTAPTTPAPTGTTLRQDLQQANEMMGPPTTAMSQTGWAERLATSQQNPQMVAEVAFDPNAPQWVRGAAEQHLSSVIQQKRAEQAANDLWTKAQQTGDFREVGKEFNKPTEEGSWLKYILFRHMGLAEASQNEASKLGLMNTVHVANGPNGEHGLITYNGRGVPVSGVTSDNQPIAPEQLNAWASLGANNAGMLKAAQTQAIQTYATTKNYLEKKAFEVRQAMGPQYDLSQDGLAPGQINARATQAASDVMNQARNTYTAQAKNEPLPGAISQGATANYVSAQPQIGGVEQPTAAGAQANEQHVKSIAEKIANYEMPAPQSRSGPYAVIMREVSRINPDYDSTKFAANQATRREFTKLTGTSGGAQVQAINRAIPHSEQLIVAAEKLDNSNMPAVNEVLNTFGKNVGDDKVAAARAIQGLVGAELQKAIAGGLGGVEERKHLSDQLSTDLSPRQLKAVIKEFQNMMLVSGQGLKQNWTSNGLPEKEFDNKFVPKVRDAMKRHEREESNTRSNW